MRDLCQLGLKKLLSIHYPAGAERCSDPLLDCGDFQSITPQGDGKR